MVYHTFTLYHFLTLLLSVYTHLHCSKMPQRILWHMFWHLIFFTISIPKIKLFYTHPIITFQEVYEFTNRVWRTLPAMCEMDYTGSYRVLYHGSITDTTKRRSWFGYTKVIQINSVYPVLTLYRSSQYNHCYNWYHAYILVVGYVNQ